MGACILFCAAYGYLSLREFLASHAARHGTLSGLQRAAQLSPENTEYHDQLGMVQFFSDNDWNGAEAHLQRATALNPQNARYWLDLSRLQQAIGNSEDATMSAERAVSVGGSYGWVLWEAGLLYLAQGDHNRALLHFRRGLEADAIPAERVIDVCWRTIGDVPSMLDLLLPAKAAPYKAFIDVLIRDGRSQQTDEAWKRMLTIGQHFPPDTSFAYIDFLLRQGRAADAAEAWHLFAENNVTLHPYFIAGENIENGGFEHDLLNGGFDWRYTLWPDAPVSVSVDHAHSGRRSLQIVFHADRLWEAPILQYVAVKPSTTYAFSVHVSTENLWTASGPRVRIRDADRGTDYVLTDEFTGSTPWTRVDRMFTTGPTTHLVTFAVVRSPGDSSITGTVWLDDVSLREAR